MKNLNTTEIQERPETLSISDDDLCATCENLAYCPGDNSLCKLAIDEPKWPATFNDDNYAISCDEYREIKNKEDNWYI